MRLRPATPADFAFIRALVQKPDYALYLTDQDEAALTRYTTSPDNRLLIWETDQMPQAGFALFANIGYPSGTVELRRLALVQLGGGKGAAFLSVLLLYAFDTLGAARVWLDTSGHNLRAQRVYAKAGFTLEGRLRQHDYCPPLGKVVDTLLYGILRAEWQATRQL